MTMLQKPLTKYRETCNSQVVVPKGGNSAVAAIVQKRELLIHHPLNNSTLIGLILDGAEFA